MKTLPIAEDLLVALAAEHGTPLYVYDLDRVAAQARRLAGFDVVRYAQKANPNPAVLTRLAAEGVHADAVSAGELVGALEAGFVPERIVYTADLFTHDALEQVRTHRVHCNLGSLDMVEQLAAIRPGAEVTLRINPGFGHGHDRKVTTGGEASKHGVWHAELDAAFLRVEAAGLRLTGLHLHIGSGVEPDDLERVIDALGGFLRQAPASVTTLSSGGGLPTPYRPEDPLFDVERYAARWMEAKAGWERELGRALTLEVEPGRFLVAEAGVLVAEVRATKRTPKLEWVLVDAGFHTLARPMLYGAYHHVSALGKDAAATRPQVVAGPLCETADVLTQDKAGRPDPRPLPPLEPGDLLCLHDVGAYGASMASRYNSMPLPCEVVIEHGVARRP